MARQSWSDEIVIHIVCLTITIPLTLYLGVWSWRRRRTPGVTAFSLNIFLVAAWLSVIALAMVSPTNEMALLWYRSGFVAISALPVLLLIFVAQYSESRLVTPGRLILLFLIPVITQLAVWTDDYFHFFFKEFSIVEKNGLLFIQTWTPGFWFIIHSAYSFICALVALAWLFTYSLKQFKKFRSQSIAFIMGGLVVILPNLAVVLGMIPADAMPMAFSFFLMNLCFAWAIFHHKLFDVVPVARNKLVDIMTDGLIVLDTSNRIVDMNPAARTSLFADDREVVGKLAQEVFAPWPALLSRFLDANCPQCEISLPSDKGDIHYDLRTNILVDAKARPSGRLILFRDITKKINIEREKDKLLLELADKNKELERLYSLALDANPMTGLPGNNSVSAAITQAMRDGLPVCVIYCDLDNFKAYNDKYGFARGDDVIQFTADLLKKSVEEAECTEAFVGHIGGDDFMVLTPSTRTEVVVDFIIREFDSKIVDFYSDEDIAQGFIASINRQGVKANFPIMSISMAGVDLSQNQYREYIEVNDACVALKKKAKSITGSSFCLDMRKTV